MFSDFRAVFGGFVMEFNVTNTVNFSELKIEEGCATITTGLLDDVERLRTASLLVDAAYDLLPGTADDAITNALIAAQKVLA